MTAQANYTSSDFHRIRHMYRSSTGITLGHHTKDLVYNRMSQRVQGTSAQNFSQYLDRLVVDSKNEWGAFTSALGSSPCCFFRDAAHFAMLKEYLQVLRTPGALLWSCAAGTGEAYSMAMTAHDALGGDVRSMKILATDIDLSALAVAEDGVYPADRLRHLPQQYKEKYLVRLACREEAYQVVPEIRRMVSFLPCNLAAQELVLKGKYDAIFCKEVFDHFDPATQQGLVGRMAGMLKPGGLLFMGETEPGLGGDQRFEHRGEKVFSLKPHFLGGAPQG
ncbi:methyltransferase domain-containing protein [Geomonas nitrogeniifigens]|uniref:Methyltransferase domain-containing protein n=1 Tax=Geomonas diazotrophica TaxID=2843197 RepID=A0ABX8JK66_9BACT|nr:CheR family methyltransferase [Geomonas nitrogeniifigens]QWV98779.1 methyltransferase domain-containing protein [Geomonas nitrogeniifigens]